MLAISAPQVSPFQNLAKLLAMSDREELQVVRVIDHTGNATDGRMLIRRQIDVPDGVYNINADGTISTVRYEHWLEYPDINMCRPPFERMQPLCELSQELIHAMLELCVEMDRVDGTAVLNKEGICMMQNTAMCLRFPFNLPQSIVLNPKYLSIALIEMLQYPLVYLLKEQRPQDPIGTDTPLVIGNGWGSCALIMPSAETRRYTD